MCRYNAIMDMKEMACVQDAERKCGFYEKYKM
jgi:hypothetical protein